jgi:hypothetical protein
MKTVWVALRALRYRLPDKRNSVLNLCRVGADRIAGLRTWRRVEERAIVTYTRV